MKKTLIALIAVAALPAFSEELDSLTGVTPYFDAKLGGTAPSTTISGWRGSFSASPDSDGTWGGRLSKDVYSLDSTLSDMSAFADGDWTVTMVINTLQPASGNDYTPFSDQYLMFFRNNANLGGLNMCGALRFDADGSLHFDAQLDTGLSFGGVGTANGDVHICNGFDLMSTTEENRITLISNSSENTFSIFFNDQEVHTFTQYNLANGSHGLMDIYINGDHEGNHKLTGGSVDFTEFKVWDKALDLTPDPVVPPVTPPPSIPEPATASLSLLGLAALLMRRRRA